MRDTVTPPKKPTFIAVAIASIAEAADLVPRSHTAPIKIKPETEKIPQCVAEQAMVASQHNPKKESGQRSLCRRSAAW